MFVKCYHENLDGTRYGLIIANSQKSAAKIAESSLYEFRNYWHQTDWPKEFNPKSFTLYTKRMNSRQTWIEGRCP